MSFQDSAVIFFIALLLFGPKKLPELARQLGKLMGEFRRASNDFRMQMEDELRISEQTERQKQIAAVEAAAPVSAAELPVDASPAENLAPHPHGNLSGPAPVQEMVTMSEQIPEHSIALETTPEPPDRHRHELPPVPLPIATSGDLAMMPPATGLPVSRNSTRVAEAFDSIPQAPSTDADATSGTVHHG
jgi:sec-independent protein translocase protein TatB